jgi:hypothetical protein
LYWYLRGRKLEGMPHLTLGFAFSILPLHPGASFFDSGSPMETLLQWETVVRWMESVLPLLQYGAGIMICYWIAVLLPMSIFRRMHPLIAATLRISSIVIAGVCWWHSFIVTFRLLGWLATAVGILCGGIGVIPMALLATAAKGDWDVFAAIIAALSLAIAPRLIARSLGNRPDNMPVLTRKTAYYNDDYNF